jgi:hypothetical protein
MYEEKLSIQSPARKISREETASNTYTQMYHKEEEVWIGLIWHGNKPSNSIKH